MLQWERTSRASIKNDCVKVYEIEKKKLKNYLKGINKISVTTDMWKSTNQKIEYMVLTGHFVDSNWRLQKRVLSFIHLPPPHRGTDIADNLYKCFKDWNIENKVFTISVENASNNDKAIKNLTETFSRIKKLPCRDILVIPITTVAPEATFSAGSRVIGNLWLPKQLKSYFVEEIGVEVFMDLKERTRKRRCQSRSSFPLFEQETSVQKPELITILLA
ncbi:zinc finger BED domain-containing protein RICESLEEPER 2-like protein [Tanacetum coccineum]|uniref:Zinc finger BED domain-containing protein RICESLEEPER 2-like protein n=1 Tax=Tanacetum coccineum TaxID=301880 RepID=A0ABQ4X9H8_9ASTR